MKVNKPSGLMLKLPLAGSVLAVRRMPVPSSFASTLPWIFMLAGASKASSLAAIGGRATVTFTVAVAVCPARSVTV